MLLKTMRHNLHQILVSLDQTLTTMACSVLFSDRALLRGRNAFLPGREVGNLRHSKPAAEGH